MMATTVEGNATSSTAGFRSSPNSSPPMQVPTYKALQREFWSSLAATRQRLSTPPVPSSLLLPSPSNLEISASTSSEASGPPLLPVKLEQANSPRIDESNAISGRKRAREDSALPLERMSIKEEPKEESQASRSEALRKETNVATTSLEVENKAIFAFWGRLIERFGGGEHEKEGSVACPEAVLLDIMEIISFYASHEITMQDAFTQLATVFRRNRCIDLYEDLVNLLLQQDISKEFLIKKGVDLAFLAKKEREEEDSEQEELATDEDEEEDEDEDCDRPPAKRAKRKSQSTRKRRNGEATTASKKKRKTSGKVAKTVKRGESDEAGRLRRSPDKWTQEEDDKLMELVEKHGTGTKKWRQIAEELGTTKNSSKCAQHWRRVLAPNIHKGSWSAEEEEKLLQGVEKYGLTQWTLVAKAIPGRTDIQCRYHYMRQQNSRACSWTLEEEKSLKKLVAKHGSENAACWVQISDELAESKIRRAPRTALECQEHWALMQKRDSKQRK